MDIRNHPVAKIHHFVFLMDKLMDRELKKKGELSFAQFMILAAVHFKPGLSQKMIASARQTTEAAVSRHVASLVKKGFLVATINPGNKKVHVLKLSLKGKSLFEKDAKITEKTIGEVFSGLSQKATGDLTRSFDILLSTIRAEFPDNQCN